MQHGDESRLSCRRTILQVPARLLHCASVFAPLSSGVTLLGCLCAAPQHPPVHAHQSPQRPNPHTTVACRASRQLRSHEELCLLAARFTQRRHDFGVAFHAKHRECPGQITFLLALALAIASLVTNQVTAATTSYILCKNRPLPHRAPTLVHVGPAVSSRSFPVSPGFLPAACSGGRASSPGPGAHHRNQAPPRIGGGTDRIGRHSTTKCDRQGVSQASGPANHRCAVIGQSPGTCCPRLMRFGELLLPLTRPGAPVTIGRSQSSWHTSSNLRRTTVWAGTFPSMHRVAPPYCALARRRPHRAPGAGASSTTRSTTSA